MKLAWNVGKQGNANLKSETREVFRHFLNTAGSYDAKDIKLVAFFLVTNMRNSGVMS